MNTEIITKMARAALKGSLPFPEIVKNLADAGVEYYHVDYIGLCTTFHNGTGDIASTPLPYEDLPPIAAELDITELKKNIQDSQQKRQNYREFSRRAMEEGVQAYYVFIRGKRAMYLGRSGDLHVEWFPGSKPKE